MPRLRSLTRSLAAATLLAALGLPAGLHAQNSDSVHLTTGELLTGKILRLNGKEVSIRLDSGGILTFKNSHVRKVRRWRRGKDLPEVILFDAEQPARDTPQPPAGGSGASTLPTLLPGVTDKGSQDLSAGAVVPDDWYLEPPPGFEVASPKERGDALQVWVDPIVNAKVVLTAHSAAVSPPEKQKAAALAELAAAASRETRVVRDQAVQRGGDGGYKGFLLEVEHSPAGKPERRIQLFTSQGDRAYVLTFSTPAADYPALARFFEESLESFRVFEPTPTAPAGAK